MTGVAAGTVLAPTHAALVLMVAVIAASAASAFVLVTRPMVVPLCAATLLLGLARTCLGMDDGPAHANALAAVGTQVVVSGRVADDPRVVTGGIDVLVSPSKVASGQGRLPPIGNLLLRVRGPVEVAVDDDIQIAGRLQLPVDQPGFDRRAYLAQRHAFLELTAARLSVVTRATGVRGLPGWLRDRYRTAISELVPSPHGAVLMGVVLGIRSGIPPGLQRDLVATGLVHLLVLSGLKVAIFARLAAGALQPLLGRAAILPTLFLVALYALVGGSTPAALRAAAMGGLVLAGSHLGRPTEVWNSLAVVAAGMLAWRPELIWDVGFQLSFAGTAAIVVLTPPIERRLRWMPGWLREPFAVTCAAQVGTVPLMATDFHLISPVAPVANALVLPALPTLVSAGLLLAPLALLPDLGRTLALPVVGLLSYLEQVATSLARVPAAAIPVPSLAGWSGAAYYSFIGGLAVGMRRSRPHRLAGLAMSVLAPLAIGGGELVAWAREPPTATVLAVGDGQAVLIGGPAGQVLIDGGPSPGRLAAELGQRLPPWRRRLDGLVITGPGQGHVGGLADFGIPAALVVLPGGSPSGSAMRSAALAAAARGAGVRHLDAGDRISVAGLEMEAIAPEAATARLAALTATADLAGSYLALRVRAPSGRSFCDLSELDAEGEALAASRLAGPCDYLLLPDRGRSSLVPELAARAGHARLIASLAGGRVARDLPAGRLLRTDQEGSITVPL